MRALALLALALLCLPGLALAQTLDGHASGQATFTSSGVSATLTTSGAGVIVALAGNEIWHVTQGNGPAPDMAVSGGGLTWIKRAEWRCDATVDCDGLGSIENATYISEWYAISSGALTGQTITATPASLADQEGIIVFGVSGADTTTVFDPALPCEFAMDASSNPMVFNGAYTNATSPFVFSWYGTTNGAQSTVPTGWTVIDDVNNGSIPGGAYYYSRAAYKLPGAALSNATITWGTGTSRGNIIALDAICGATGGCNGSVRSTCPNHPAAAAVVNRRVHVWIAQ